MLSRSLPINEAKDHLTGLVRLAAKGARLTITVHGHPMADLVPHEPLEKPAMRPLRPVPARVKLSPGPGLDAIMEELRGDR